jgi:hypothetical protein
MAVEHIEREAKSITEAGEIIQHLTAPRLATLAVLEDGYDTQLEMADALGCSSSLVSKHLTTFANLPTPILDKPDNTFTAVGAEIFGEVDSLLHRLGVSLDSIDWQDETEMAEVEQCLAPLPAARGPLSFLVFYSIGVSNSVGGRIDLLNQEPVSLSTVVSDVRARRQRRGETTERKHVRRHLTTLADAGSITFEDATIILTEKGKAQARFVEQIIQAVGNAHGDDLSVREPSTVEEQSVTSVPDKDDGIPLTIDTATDKMSLVPEYRFGDESAVALSSTITVGEFVEQAVRLREEYDEDTSLNLTWMVRPQTEDVGQFIGLPSDSNR